MTGSIKVTKFIRKVATDTAPQSGNRLITITVPKGMRWRVVFVSATDADNPNNVSVICQIDAIGLVPSTMYQTPTAVVMIANSMGVPVYPDTTAHSEILLKAGDIISVYFTGATQGDNLFMFVNAEQEPDEIPVPS